MAHVNSTEVQTAEGVVTVTKTSTHRDYVAVSAVQFADGTQVVLSWHLTADAAAKAIWSKSALRTASYYDSKRGTTGATLTVLPVVVTLTGKDATEAAAAAPVAADFVPQSEAEEAAQEATAGTTATECTCQCGKAVSKGKNYLPGHDARHAASIARLLVQGRQEGWGASQLNHLVESLPTSALRAKALGQAHRLGEKVAAKAAKASK